MAKKVSRRSFLECALAGGAAAATANLTIMKDAFAQSSGAARNRPSLRPHGIHLVMGRLA